VCRAVVTGVPGAQEIPGSVDPTPSPPMSITITTDGDLRRLIRQYVPSFSAEEPIDVSKYDAAFTHRSCIVYKCDRSQCNERSEFLGDAVVYLIAASYLHERFPGQQEGFLTRLRSTLVRGDTLAHLCETGTCIPDLVRMGKSAEVRDLDERSRKRVMEDALEAFLGALYLDQGYEVARQWMVGLYEAKLDFAQLVLRQDNVKDALNRRFKESFGHLPVLSSKRSTDVSCRRFIVQVLTRQGHVVGSGDGQDRAEAEQNAARAALSHMGLGQQPL
jgi:ribonuclease-3